MMKLINEYLDAMGKYLAIREQHTNFLRKQSWSNSEDGKTLRSLRKQQEEADKKVKETIQKIHDALDGRFYVMPSGEILVAFMDSEDGPEIQLLKEYKDEAE